MFALGIDPQRPAPVLGRDQSPDVVLIPPDQVPADAGSPEVVAIPGKSALMTTTSEHPREETDLIAAMATTSEDQLDHRATQVSAGNPRRVPARHGTAI